MTLKKQKKNNYKILINLGMNNKYVIQGNQGMISYIIRQAWSVDEKTFTTKAHLFSPF